MLNVRTDLYIVEIALVNQTGDDGLATIPSHLILRMMAMHVLGKNIDVLRFCIPAHETNTGNTIPVIPDKSVKYHGRERLTYIAPQILGMTSRTATGTIGDINRECYLIGNLLKDNTSIDVFQHTKQRKKKEAKGWRSNNIMKINNALDSLPLASAITS